MAKDRKLRKKTYKSRNKKLKIKTLHFRDMWGNLLWSEAKIFEYFFEVGSIVSEDGEKYVVRHFAYADTTQHLNIERIDNDNGNNTGDG